MRLTELAHIRLAHALQPGDTVVDTTAGNGHDTLALARAVGPTGRVWAFDIQARALDATRKRLEQAGVAARVHLVHASHAQLREHLPVDIFGYTAGVMANLGYLPGGDTTVITDPGETLLMLHAALSLLRPLGVCTVMAYPGHPGGDTEAAAVLAFLQNAARESGATLEIHGDPHDVRRSPWLAVYIRPAVSV